MVSKSIQKCIQLNLSRRILHCHYAYAHLAQRFGAPQGLARWAPSGSMRMAVKIEINVIFRYSQHVCQASLSLPVQQLLFSSVQFTQLLTMEQFPSWLGSLWLSQLYSPFSSFPQQFFLSVPPESFRQSQPVLRNSQSQPWSAWTTLEVCPLHRFYSFHWFADNYCHYVDNSTFVKVFSITGILLLLAVPVYIGCTSVEGNLDYRQLLKKDSPRRHGVYLMSDVVWPTWFSIMFFVSKPPNFSSPKEYGRFKSMIAEIEEIDNKLPQSTDMVWINDFCRHTNSKPSDDGNLSNEIFLMKWNHFSTEHDPIQKLYWRRNLQILARRCQI